MTSGLFYTKSHLQIIEKTNSCSHECNARKKKWETCHEDFTSLPIMVKSSKSSRPILRLWNRIILSLFSLKVLGFSSALFRNISVSKFLLQDPSTKNQLSKQHISYQHKNTSCKITSYTNPTTQMLCIFHLFQSLSFIKKSLSTYIKKEQDSYYIWNANAAFTFLFVLARISFVSCNGSQYIVSQ